MLSGRIVGARALIRWQHPERGRLYPGDFIAPVDDFGLLIVMGEWVIGEACWQNAAWCAAGLPPVPVAVNLASTQLRECGLPARVAQTLPCESLPAGALEIEVTESILLAFLEVHRCHEYQGFLTSRAITSDAFVARYRSSPGALALVDGLASGTTGACPTMTRS